MATVRFGEFEWDDKKAAINARKHGVTFKEAATAFRDEHLLILTDPQEHDDRFVALGMSTRARVLFVVHAEIVATTRGATRTRIISARIAKPREATQYALGDAP